jgi:AraC family transcriptional regulator
MEPLADVHVLYRSAVGRVLDFHCRQPGTGGAQREYQRHYGAVFTRKGAYECRIGKQSACVHSGLLLLDDAGTERVVKHYGMLRDECTNIEFSADLLRAANNRRRTGFTRFTLPMTAELESLHALILAAAKQGAVVPALRIDLLVLNLLRLIERMSGAPANQQSALDRKAREFYLENIDRAKNLMRTRFCENLSLGTVARVAGISVFHFSRLFKSFTGRAPHQYLIQLRLEHARILLRNTRLSVTEVCFASGFGSLEHFLAMFRQRYGLSPRRYRTVATANLPAAAQEFAD